MSATPPSDQREGVFITGGLVSGSVVGVNQGSITNVTYNTAAGTIVNVGRELQVKRLMPNPPRSNPVFFDREQLLADAAGKLGSRGGVWLAGRSGSGRTAALRQLANSQTTPLHPEGTLYLDGQREPDNLDDLTQSLYNCFFVADDGSIIRKSRRVELIELSNIDALFVLDNPQLESEELSELVDMLTGRGAVLTTADGSAPDTLDVYRVEGLPQLDAIKLLVAESQIATSAEPATAALLVRLCEALAALPLPLLLAARILRAEAADLAQLVAAAEELRSEREPVLRAAKLILNALQPDESAVLAALTHGCEVSATSDMLATITDLDIEDVELALERLDQLRVVARGKNRYSIITASLRRAFQRALRRTNERKAAAAFLLAAFPAHQLDLSWIGTEAHNLTAAAQTLVDDGQFAQAGDLLRAAQPHYVLSGRWNGWNRANNLLAQTAQTSGNAALQALALHEQGTYAGLHGDLPQASAKLQEAHKLRMQLGDQVGADASLHNLRYFGLAVVQNNSSDVLARLPNTAGFWRFGWWMLAALLIAIIGLVGLYIYNSRVLVSNAILRINCGGDTVDGWASEASYYQGDGAQVLLDGANAAGTSDALPADVSRSVRQAQHGIYTLSKLVPNVAYTLRLYFVPPEEGARAAIRTLLVSDVSAAPAAINLRINNTLVLKQFDPGAGTEQPLAPREFVATANAQGVILVQIDAVSGRFALSAIEVVDGSTGVPTALPSDTPTVASTATAVPPSNTPTWTPSPSVVASPTQTLTPTATLTPTPSSTPTPSVTLTPSVTPTPSATPTPSVTLTPSITPTPSVTLTPSQTPMPSETPTPSATLIPSATPTPAPAPLPPTHLNRAVIAFYYPWYEQNEWSLDTMSDLPAPTYSGGDADVMRRHIQQASDAGINVLACAWYGPREDRINGRCLQLLRLAAESGTGMRVALFPDPASFEQSLYTPDGMAEALDAMQKNFASSSAYYTVDGRPVTFFFQPEKLGSSADWQSLRDRVDPTRQQFWFIGTDKFNYLDASDAVYFFDISWEAKSGQAMRSYAAKLAAYKKSKGVFKPFIATAQPGYNDQKIRGPGHVIRDRADGEYYRGTWRDAGTYNADAVVLATFNEFKEGSYIEPSQLYGDLYLRLTREGVQAYKNR